MLSLKRFHVFLLISIIAISFLAQAQQTVTASKSQEPQQKSSKIQNNSQNKDSQTPVVQQQPLQIGVIVLTQQTFDKRLDKITKPWFIKIYAPWCGHCKRLAPTWDELADKLQGQVNVAKVDATVQTDISSRLDVRGYPTLLLTEDGKNFIQYKGQRSLESLESFALGGYKDASDDQKSEISDGSKFAIFTLAIMRSFKELDRNIDDWLIQKGIISSPTSGYLKVGLFLMIFIIPFIFVGICSFFVFGRKDGDGDQVLTQEADLSNRDGAKNKPEKNKND